MLGHVQHTPQATIWNTLGVRSNDLLGWSLDVSSEVRGVSMVQKDLAEHIEDLVITQFFLHPQNISETITCLLGFSCSENFRDIAVIT